MEDNQDHKKQTVCILGGGFAGLAAAVHCDQLGYQVTLVERKPILGGRAYAFRDVKNSDWLDNGQHMLVGAYHETIELISTLGAMHQLNFNLNCGIPLYTQNNKLAHFNLKRLPYPFNILWAFLLFKGISLKDKWNLYKIQKSLIKFRKNPESFYQTTVQEWLKEVGQSEFARINFWENMTLATLNDKTENASAACLLTVLTQSFMGSYEDSQIILPQTDLNELLAAPAHQYLTLRGHTIRTKTAAKKIHILDHRVLCVELHSGERVKSDLLISALPHRALLNILPEGFVHELDYFKNLQKLKTSPIISMNLWFDQDFIKQPFVGMSDKTVHWYFNKNLLSHNTKAPFHYMGIMSGASELIDLSKEDIVSRALKELAEVFPEASKAKLLRSLVNKEREATLAPTPEVEQWRPHQKTPIENFYLVGDWTQTGLPGTIESAVLSAKLVKKDLKNRLGL